MGRLEQLRARARADRLAEEERRRRAVRAWLPRSGITLRDLGYRLGWAVGAHDVLVQMAELGEAHEVPPLWFPGPDPSRPPTREVRVNQTPDNHTTRRPAFTPPETLKSIQDRVLAYVLKHPGTSAGDAASELGLEVHQVSSALRVLKTRKVVTCTGKRNQGRWSPKASSSSPAAPLPPAPAVERGPAESTARAPAEEGDLASLLLWLLDELGVESHPDIRIRVGICTGMFKRRSVAS